MRPRAVVSGLVLLATDVVAVAASYYLAYAVRTLVLAGLLHLLREPMPLLSMAKRWYLLLVYLPAFAYEGLYTKRYVD
ncbi:hypothetical protein FJY71_06060, partial [candidate division WOR-3 bacterium]|nr:hypothetical protein [candidate division WOR-3 bacterium]